MLQTVSRVLPELPLFLMIAPADLAGRIGGRMDIDVVAVRQQVSAAWGSVSVADPCAGLVATFGIGTATLAFAPGCAGPWK
jgi:hypothetical protein